jgi:hypothetical protein
MGIALCEEMARDKTLTGMIEPLLSSFTLAINIYVFVNQDNYLYSIAVQAFIFLYCCIRVNMLKPDTFRPRLPSSLLNSLVFLTLFLRELSKKNK